MSKKFDVVIGNPPYQDESVGTATYAMPIYHEFMDAAHEVGEKAVLITPARFLFNAGFTPKAWNKKMLADQHLTVEHYVENSNDLFPGTDIKGGVAVTYHDKGRTIEPIGTFARHNELQSVLQKVRKLAPADPSLASLVGKTYRYTKLMNDIHPKAVEALAKGHQLDIGTHAFERLPFLYSTSEPIDDNEYCRMFGLIKNKRHFRWIRRDFVNGPPNFDKFKVALPKANGTGSFGETISTPEVLFPNTAVTYSFLTIGDFSTEVEAEACRTYIKSKFARALLGVHKVTQDNTQRVWKGIPLQDFTENSDIDWSKSIPEIDAQLYEKYGLNDEEIEFIESRVKPME